jgi:glycosyltransferase involved in cell wall biosynthesis
MRITLLTHYFPAHRGGIELVAAELARHLAAKHGAEIEWHASDCDAPPSIPGVEAVPAKSWNGVERRVGVPYPFWSPASLWRAGRAARAADAVHLHDCLYLPNLLIFAAARIAGRPILVTQHVGMIPYRNPALRALLKAAYAVFGRLVLGGASRVVFVSDSVRRYFSGFVRFKAPPLLVANGVDASVFHPPDEESRTALRLQLGAVAGTQQLPSSADSSRRKASRPASSPRGPEARWIRRLGTLTPEIGGPERRRFSRLIGYAPGAAVPGRGPALVPPERGRRFSLGRAGKRHPAARPLWSGPTAPDVPTLPPCCSRGGHRRVGRDIPLGASHPGADDRSGPGRFGGKVAAYAAANWSWERCAERADLFGTARSIERGAR